MLMLLRHNLKIVAPTLIWTGILIILLVVLILLAQFGHASDFKVETAGQLAEQFVPLIAAFFSAGVLDAEMKRGAHELLCSKYRPLWHTVAYRLGVSLALAVFVGTIMLAALHFGVKPLPLGMLLLASLPSSLCLALISLWMRIRLGNAFLGYMAALAIWLASLITNAIESGLNGISINPLITLGSYTTWLHADAAGALETTPYVDWWWMSKLALLLWSLFIFLSVTRRVENLVETD